MSYRVLLAAEDNATAIAVRALLDEAGDFQLLEVVTSAGDLIAAAGQHDAEVVLVHEDLGPVPVMHLVRDLGARHPQVGVVVMARDGSPDMLRAALESGARGVVTLPLALEELDARLTTAAAWSRSIRARLSGESVAPVGGVGGSMIALAGAKGGVGTTTLAVHLALEAARRGSHQRVCLVDFDLQAGDVANVLGITHRHSVSDLVEAAEDVTTRNLEEVCFVHESGLRVLLGPEHGERAEDVKLRHARQILGGLKSRFDLVIVDCGTVVTEASSIATEMADTMLVVATTDVPALRAARRLLRLWTRLQLRKEDDVILVMNRTSRRTEVQPDLARRVVGTRVAATTVPAAFRSLEPAVNTGVPERLEDGPIRRAFSELAVELGIASPSESRPARGGWSMRQRSQVGQVAVESVVVLAFVFLLTLVVVQVVLTGLTFVLAGHAATEGSRQVAVSADPHPAAMASVPSAWRSGAEVAEGPDWVEVKLRVPFAPEVLPGPVRIASRAGTVREP